MNALIKTIISASILLISGFTYSDTTVRGRSDFLDSKNAADKISNSLIGMEFDFNKTTNHLVKVDQHKTIVEDYFVAQNTSETSSAPSDVFAESNLKSLKLKDTFNGQEAIDFLGAKIQDLAKKQGTDVDYLKHQLLNDPTLLITKDGNVMVVEPGLPKDNGGVIAKDAGVLSPTLEGGSVNTLENVFTLHSKPNSTKRIYLDFTGHVTSMEGWGDGTAVAYTLDADPEKYSDTEREQIYEIWAAVSEDYSSFDVDITTEEPTDDQIVRKDFSDQEYGVKIVVTSSAPAVITGIGNLNIGGIAYVNIYDYVNFDYITTPSTYNPYKSRVAWAFAATGLGNGTKYIAEAVSHEAGHTFGLYHHGIVSNGVSYAYYLGHGAGKTGWAPIMGAGYYKSLTQWSNGSYQNATNPQQSDLIVINSKLAIVSDDVANATDLAPTLTEGSTINNVRYFMPYYGMTGNGSDVDLFKFNLNSTATVNLSATNYTRPDLTSAGNTDIKMSILDFSGNIVSVSDDNAIVSASISASLEAGLYYVKVEAGNHVGDNITDLGYPTYGCIGQYALSGSYSINVVPTATPVPSATPSPVPTLVPTSVPTHTGTPIPTQVPIAPKAVIDAPEKMGIVPVTVHFSANDSVAGNDLITSYFWDFGDNTSSTESNPVHTFTRSGIFTTTLIVENSYGLTDVAYTTTKVYATNGPAVNIKKMVVGFKVSKVRNNYLISTVKVVDQLKKSFMNAAVKGKFTGTYREIKGGDVIDISSVFPNEFSVVTNKAGQAYFKTPTTIKIGGGATMAFTVTNVEPMNEFIYYNASKDAVTTKTHIKK